MAAVASMQRLRRVGKSDAAIYRNWSIASEFVRAAIDIRKGQLETADWDLQPRTSDLPDPDKGLMARIRELLNSPNPGDESFGTFISAVAEDIMVLDAGSIEKERKLKGEILWLWPTDGAFIKVDRFWNGDPKMPRYYFEPQPSWSVPLLNSDLVYMMIHRRSNLPVGISYLEILKQAINFLVLAGVLVYFLRKPLSSFLKERSELLRKAIDDAAKARAEAAEKLAAIETRTAKLADEIAGMNAKMDVEAAAEARRLQETVAVEISRIRAQSEFTGEQEVKKAREELRREASLLTAHAAEELVRKTLSPEDQERLVRENLEKIERIVH